MVAKVFGNKAADKLETVVVCLQNWDGWDLELPNRQKQQDFALICQRPGKVFGVSSV